MQHQGYQVEAIPRARATIVDALAVGARRHMVHGFVEVDVTRARQIIRRHEHDTGEALSFTAFVIAAAARAIAANKHLNAYRDWRNRLVVFDDVDVATLVEGEAGAVGGAARDPRRQPEELSRNPRRDPGRSGAARKQPAALGVRACASRNVFPTSCAGSSCARCAGFRCGSGGLPARPS